jgi:hypothetical protein
MRGQGYSIKANGIVGIIFLVLLLVALFFLAKGIFTILAWLSPVLILGAIILNYKTVLGYLKFILSLFQRNPLAGIIAVLLSVLGFPILSGVLFGKAIFDRKIRRLQRAHEASEAAEYVPYEEVIKPDPKESLELPPLDKQKAEKKENRYDNLF